MYAVEYNLHLIGIAETWLHEDISDGEVNLEGFTLYRKDRHSVKSGKGGGVVLYISNSLVSSACEELNKYKAEAVWCNLHVEKGSVVTVGVCYRSPTVEDDELEQLFTSIKQASRNHVLIMGDFNYPDINWDTMYHSNLGSEFVELVLDNFLIQHVDEPTREKNILDLVCLLKNL